MADAKKQQNALWIDAWAPSLFSGFEFYCGLFQRFSWRVSQARER